MKKSYSRCKDSFILVREQKVDEEMEFESVGFILEGN